MSRFRQILPNHNRILAALPRQELEKLSSHMHEVNLGRGDILFDVGEQVGHAYFATSGIVSLLSVSSGGVSSAAGSLQKSGLIRYARGRITILSRERLEAAACECYQVIRDDLDLYLPLTER